MVLEVAGREASIKARGPTKSQQNPRRRRELETLAVLCLSCRTGGTEAQHSKAGRPGARGGAGTSALCFLASLELLMPRPKGGWTAPFCQEDGTQRSF